MNKSEAETKSDLFSTKKKKKQEKKMYLKMYMGT